MTKTSSVFMQVCADCRFASAFNSFGVGVSVSITVLHAVFNIFFVRIACVSFSQRVSALWAPCRTGWESAGGCSIFFCQLQHLRDAMFSSTTTVAHTLLTPEIHEAHFSLTPLHSFLPFLFCHKASKCRKTSGWRFPTEWFDALYGAYHAPLWHIFDHVFHV